MRTVRANPVVGLSLPSGVATAATIGFLAQLVLLTALAGTVGLNGPGWVLGTAYAVVATALTAHAFDRAGAEALGPADWVTLTRLVLVGGVTALVADAALGKAAGPALIVLAAVALALDAADGWTARRTRTASYVGGRFDMEVDAFLLLVLSGYVAQINGGWVLAIGAARYLYVAAGWTLPWLRTPVPPRYWRKVVAAFQGIVLTVAAAQVLPAPVIGTALLVGIGLLAESFGRDVRWQWRHRVLTRGGFHAYTGTNTDGRVPAVGHTDCRAAPDNATGPVDTPGAGETAVAGDDGPGSTTGTGSTTGAGPEDRRSRRRRIVGYVTTVLACALVWFALLVPNDVTQLTPLAFLRIPVEALLVVAALLLLPTRPARALAVVTGVLLSVITIVKALDIGFRSTLSRPFNPLSDWAYIGHAVRLLGDSIGQVGATISVIVAVLLIVAVLVSIPLAVRRVSRIAVRHRTAASRFVVGFGVVWLVVAVAGLHWMAGTPIASAGAATLTYDKVDQLWFSIRDRESFAAAIGDDPSHGVDPAELLTALRGKDVIIAFVESYGRIAVQDSPFSARIDAVLDSATRDLSAAGYSSRSAFLTSPTFGGASWLAHATVHSGLWIDSQQRHDQLMASDRLTLSQAFGRAGWRTVLDAPANREEWPEAQSFYRFDQVYDSRNIGYQGPPFGFSTPPDQYTLAALWRAEFAATPRPPVLAEVDLLSSHTPWAPLPQLVDWDTIGDGSGYAGMPEQAAQPEAIWGDADAVRAAYGQSIDYSLSALTSFVLTYGNDDLVVLAMGDHQPAPIIAGSDSNRDAPISIIAKDPAVMQRIDAWAWADGMNPGPHAPVWPMDSLRDRFFDAFSS